MMPINNFIEKIRISPILLGGNKWKKKYGYYDADNHK